MTLPSTSGTLFLVCHGRTATDQDRYVGWGNPPLDDRGTEQSAMLLRTLRGEHIDDIYSSPSMRAIQTAHPLAAVHSLEIRIRPQLREINYGAYEGMDKDMGRLKLRAWHRYERMPRGESLFDLYRRVRELSAEIAYVLRGGHRIVVVGHYWSNRMLVGCLDDRPFEAIVDDPPYKPANGSVLEVICRRTSRGVSIKRAALRGQAGMSS